MTRKSILSSNGNFVVFGRILIVCIAFLALGVSALPAAGLLTSIKSPNPINQGAFGGTVASVPDANGDGKTDIVVSGNTEKSGTVATAGTAYVFSSAGALVSTLVSQSPKASGGFGFSMVGIPDYNGDGRGDVLVGASAEDNPGVASAGKAYLFSGKDGAILKTFTSPNAEPNGKFGVGVAAIPDFTGDGKPEFLFGAVSEDSMTTNGGRAYLYSGDGTTLIKQIESPNKADDGDFGARVCAVPDVDGDGKWDYAITGWREKVGTVANAGRVYIYSSATHTAIRTLQSPTPKPGNTVITATGNFGTGLAGLDDVNNDGRGDLAVAAWMDFPQPFNKAAGVVYIFSGIDGALIRIMSSPNPEVNSLVGNFGRSISAVPDVTGDWRNDVVVGAWGDDVDTTNTGRAYVFASAGGSTVTNTAFSSFISPNPKDTVTVFGLAVYGNFGSSVAGLPDIDGDLRGEVAVGAPADLDDTETTSGMTYIYNINPSNFGSAGAKDWEKY